MHQPYPCLSLYPTCSIIGKDRSGIGVSFSIRHVGVDAIVTATVVAKGIIGRGRAIRVQVKISCTVWLGIVIGQQERFIAKTTFIFDWYGQRLHSGPTGIIL